jgi:signal peptidase
MTEYQSWGPEPRPEVARDPWSTDFDQVRATVQALQGAATLLQGAMEQRQGLWSEMRNAEQKLNVVEAQRREAELALHTATTQLERTARDLSQVREEQSGVLSEFDRLVQAALARRSALLAEIGELERRRDGLVVAPPLPRLVHFEPSEVREPTPVAVMLESAAQEPPAAEPPVGPEPPTEPPAPPPVEPPAATAPPRSEPISFPVTPLAERHHGRRFGLRGLTTVVLGTLLLGLAVLLTPVTQVVGGLELLAVMSGSMESTIHVGGIVGVMPVPAASLQVGDVITFTNQSNPDVLVTHRVVSIEERGNQELLTTRGDANDSADAVAVPASRAVGRVQFTLPWLGYAMVYLASPLAKLAILAVAVIGLVLPSVKRTPPAPSEVPARTTSYAALERELEKLLPKAS